MVYNYELTYKNYWLSINFNVNGVFSTDCFELEDLSILDYCLYDEDNDLPLTHEQEIRLENTLKQLINDDNQLQKKLIDAKTIERKSRQRKDW